MNDSPPDEDKIRAALITAASTNQSLRRPRFKQLMRFQEQIRELRSQDASFSTIEKILRKNALHVSHETIRIFYREVIEQKPLKRKQRQRKTAIKKRVSQSKTTALPKTRDVGEPRIARIEDL
jgi:hypothetical protein